jgi:UDP-GlcNAc:undecaprenyl-phosphate GlcNAc-1-phosphate transferase
MSSERDAAAAFAIAALATYLATPLAIKLAVRTSFYDRPVGYKVHGRSTPYLGGLAIIAGVLAALLSLGRAVAPDRVLIAAAITIFVVGTLDDRVNLPLLLRISVEVGLATLLWSTGRGWHAFQSGPADLALTIFWVVAVTNAFNLMDNMDGAAASTAAVSAIGAGALMLISGVTSEVPLAFAVAGTCLGFLPWNLSRPARIFMGDGGSLLIGLLVAGVTMGAVTRSWFGPSGVLVGALLVGLVILDTTLVTVSRSRGRRPLLSGGRDHLTHRLAARLDGPRNVALILAVTQLTVCAVTIAVVEAGVGWVLLTGGVGMALGALLIWQFERSAWFAIPEGPRRAHPVAALPLDLKSDVPEESAGLAVP